MRPFGTLGRSLLLTILPGFLVAAPAAQDQTPTPAIQDDEQNGTPNAAEEAVEPQRREPPEPAAGTTRTTVMSALTIDLPESFRELLPNEALDYENRWPFVIATSRPGTYEVYGDVDRWMAEGFDGEAVVVARSDIERPIDSSSLETLREAIEGVDRDGNRRKVRDAVITEVGFFDHPAILLELDYQDRRFGDFRVFETHASTSGDEYVIVHLLGPERLAADPEAPERLRATLRFIAPPKDPEELPDRLLNAALLGAAIAVVLLVLRKLQRPGPPTA